MKPDDEKPDDTLRMIRWAIIMSLLIGAAFGLLIAKTFRLFQ
mgnify:CR=1 FL=1|jgi:hypothetical protein